MSNAAFANIPTDVLADAATLIGAQKQTPKSPCKLENDGHLSLCAAAAIAAIGMEKVHGVAARAFLESVMQTQGMPVVLNAFEKLGYGRKAAETALGKNDSLPDASRSQEVRAFLLA